MHQLSMAVVTITANFQVHCFILLSIRNQARISSGLKPRHQGVLILEALGENHLLAFSSLWKLHTFPRSHPILSILNTSNAEARSFHAILPLICRSASSVYLKWLLALQQIKVILGSLRPAIIVYKSTCHLKSQGFDWHSFGGNTIMTTAKQQPYES